MKYLLDTNICIYIIKKKPEHVRKKFNSFPMGSIGISSITLSELEFGIHKSSMPDKNRLALDEFILPLEILNFDSHASRFYGKIRYVLESKGKPIGSLDTLIAAHALSRKLTLITNNIKEFKRVPALKIENWV